ncbi:uncharacterized protein LOC100892050 [Strongylocentrotus purpuratus]|uniref:Uncharacterized protein n=1 Tax=Strongylocentrotus purpuratus TaxID=7668 RepID=A0A7M7N6G1_STRPU|nr:uncharacterized protein LOC100892050 [Strongylocentrotus purpuratus]
MDFASIKSQGQVIDVFEDLFHQYSNLTELPKFKKRKLTQVGNFKVCKNIPNLSNPPLLHQSSIQASRLAEDHGQQTGNVSLHPHAKDQGSFSSGVFSIDSDIDNLNDDGECGDECHMESRRHPLDQVEENFLSSEAPSEAGSGVVERPLQEEGRQDHVSLNQDGNDIPQEGTGKLTDEDILFMMHKPRLKKRRKKPPWQKRKLDLDDLWVKGQHLQCHHSSDQEEEVTTKLFLDRNLRWGKISLQKYICAMRKSRKGRKWLNNGSRGNLDSKKKSLKDTSHEDKSFEKVTSNARLATKSPRNELPASIPQKRTLIASSGKKGIVNREKKTGKRAKKSTRWFEDAPDNTSDTSEQDFRQRSELEISSCAFPKVNRGNDVASRAKEEKGKRKRKSQKASRKVKESKADTVDSKVKGRLQKTEGSKKCRVSGGRRGSSTSKGNSSWIDIDSASEPSGVTRTQSGSEWLPSDTTGQESSQSQESVVNFICLTPRKSCKLSRRQRRAEEKRKTNPLSTSDSSNFGGPIRGVSLHPRGSLLPVTDFPGWDDEEEVECRPLFSQGRHCGGVWNTIIEESS